MSIAPHNILARHDIQAVEKALKKARKAICENKQQKKAAKAWIANCVCQTNHGDNKTISDIADELWGMIKQFEEDQDLDAQDKLLAETEELTIVRNRLFEERFNSEPPLPYEGAVPNPIAAIATRISELRISWFTDDELEEVLSQFKTFVSRPKDELKKSLKKALKEISRLRSLAEKLDEQRFQAFKTIGEHGKAGWLQFLEINEDKIMELTRLRNLKAQCEQDIEALQGLSSD